MKNLKNISLILAVLCSMTACREENLDDFNLGATSPVEVAAGSTTDNINKTNASVSLRVSLQLSGPSSKAFEIALRVNQEAVAQQIEDGTLTDVVAVAASAVQIDNVAKVAYGSNAAHFQLTITRTELEKYFGQKIAVGYTLENAGKNNNIDQDNDTGIIILNTNELLTEEDIHYIYLQAGGNIITARDRQNYTSASGGISIPISAGLASFPGNAFSVNIRTDADTIADMVADGSLPANTVALQADAYTISSKLNFQSNASEAVFELSVPWTTVNENEGKQLAIVVRLEDPTLHLVDPSRSYTTVLIDCDNILEEDVTHLGAFSVSRENRDGPDANEGSLKMVDNNFSSKFLLRDFTGDLQCTLVFEEPQKIGAYTLTSGNDAQSRDPNAWTLQGSNDGETWTTVDSRQNETFPNRLMTRRFNIAYPVAYTHYRINMTSIVGGTSIFQITEWRMIKVR